MNGHTGQHRTIDFLILSSICIFLCAAVASCEQTCYDDEKNNNEEGVDCGGPCVPCDTSEGTCFDGILNQGEEDIDCGGPCNICIPDSVVFEPDFICEGSGGSSWFPLSEGNYWYYKMQSGWFGFTVEGTNEQNNLKTYYHVKTDGTFGITHNYYREENGEIYEWNVDLSIEEVYIPANPAAGFQWTTSTADSIVIEDVEATLNSQNGCTYNGLLKRTSYLNGNASTSYFKQGLGLVELSSISAYLDSAVVF